MLLQFPRGQHNFTEILPVMKNQTKKIFFTTWIFTLISMASSAQSWIWSEPQPVTDSLADNRNAQVVIIPFTSGIDHYIFWERSDNSSSTAIYYRRFYNQSEPVALLESPGVHYRNPRFMVISYWGWTDTLFYMFYESDQNGNFDIFYQVYTNQGFGAPEVLAGTSEDDTHFRCDANGGLTWQEGGKIKSAKLMQQYAPIHISDIVTIDSSGCHSPDIILGQFITYLKKGADTSAIYYTYNWGSTWADPILINSPGDNVSLSFSTGTCGDDGSMGIPFIVWENVMNGEHTIRAWDLWEEEFTSGFTQMTPFLPGIALYMIPVDILGESFMTFVNDLEGNGDIMVTDGMLNLGISPNLEDYLNLSNSSFSETNPAFFNGGSQESCYIDLINVWESFRNGHWQLFYSMIALYCCGGDEETNVPCPEMLVYPNPARDFCIISYYVPADSYVSLHMTTHEGRQISLIDHDFLPKGSYEYLLDRDQVFSGSYVSGMFMVSLETSNGMITRKVLLAR